MDTHLTSLVKQTKLVCDWWKLSIHTIIIFLTDFGKHQKNTVSMNKQAKELKIFSQVTCPYA